MKGNKFVYLFWIILFITLLSSHLFAQVTGSYARGKITLKTGSVVEGKKLVLTSTSATMNVGGVVQTYNLSDVNQIMARGNKGRTGCLIAGGGCAALGLISYLVADDETFEEYYDKSKSEASGQYFLGLALWTGCFGGLGYLIGNATDDWDIVYVSAQPGTGFIDYWQPDYAENLLPYRLLGHYIE